MFTKKEIKFLFFYLRKHFYGIVFYARNIGGNKKLFPPFQVRGNDAVTERSLPPNFGV